MTETIKVFCTIDQNYVQHCGAMLTSLFENNQQERFDVYLITDGISEESFASLLRLVRGYDSQLIMKIVDIDILRNFPLPDYKSSQYSLANYYRILIPELLPFDVDKIIYFDCDLIIRGNIRELWDINMDGFALAAIDDATFTAIKACERLSIDISTYYYNTGVLIINLEYWRKFNISDKVLDFINCNKEKIKIVDQDALNAVLNEKRLKLPIRWNMLECFYTIEGAMTEDQKVEMAISGDNPIVIHWATELKPWMYGSNNPFKQEYYKYLANTEWKDYKPSIKNLFNRFGWKRSIFICLKMEPAYYKIALYKKKIVDYIRI